MNRTFKYSVLKYIHSQFRGEELNLGLVFHFPESGKLVFRALPKLGKFKSIYPRFNEKTIKQYLKFFEGWSRLVENENLGKDLSQIIKSNLLIPEAATLEFSEVYSAVQKQNDEATVEQYFQLYFGDESNVIPGQIKLIEKKITDKGLSRNFEQLLFSKDPTIGRFIGKAYEIHNKNAHFKADLVWQNHTLNAVKGLSLDVGSEEKIEEKTLATYARLNFLEDVAREKKTRFDLIVAKPKSIELIGAYQNAVDILNEIKAPKKIITEDLLDNYSETALSEIERK